MRAATGTLARRVNHPWTAEIRARLRQMRRGDMTFDPYAGSGDGSGDG